MNTFGLNGTQCVSCRRGFVFSVVTLVAITFSIPAKAQNTPQLAGAWRSSTGKVTLVLTQEGAKLRGRLEEEGVNNEIDGGATSTGAVVLGEYCLRENSPSIPDTVWGNVLKTKGTAYRPGAVRADIRLQYDAAKNELTGTREALSVTYSAIPPNPVRRINVNPENVTFTRVTNLPDFQVTAFSSVDDRFNDAATKRKWDIRAMIRNSGVGNAPRASRVRLEAGYQKPSERTPKFTALSPWIEVPALFANISTQVLWTSGELPAPAGGTYTARFTPPADPLNLMALRVVADSEKSIEESSESNNDKTLWRLDAAPCARGSWVEIPTVENDKATPTEKFRQWRIAASPEDKARAVLCFIKMEAQRRAKRGAGSVAGSNMMRALTTHFLKDYFADPTQANADKAIEAIGAYQGIPGLRGTLWVPAGVRKMYPEIPDWLVPATQFWVINKPGFGRGNNIQHLPMLDVPFLVGVNNPGTGNNDDVSGGGRNLSNVMHWATGVKYGHLPKDGLRTLFIGYELWHLEGWDTFSEDPINDLISEEQGRMLGARLKSGGVASPSELAYAMNEDFRESRAWVGALLRERREEFETLILAPAPSKSNFWWGYGGMRAMYAAPWGDDQTAGKTIKQLLAEGKNVEVVVNSTLVDRLIQIYTLIYEVEEWEKQTGKTMQLTPAMRQTVRGQYNAQFRSVSKSNTAEWDWTP